MRFGVRKTYIAENIQNISNSSKGLWEMKIYPFELISYSKNKSTSIILPGSEDL